MTNKINMFRGLLILAALFLMTFNAFSSEEHHKSEKFNAGELIIEHISDAHEWHLWGHLSVPLPIIIYDTKKGFDAFLSSRFEHGTKSYHGYRLAENHIIPHDEEGSQELEAMGIAPADAIVQSKTDKIGGIYDFSITKNVLSLFITFGLMLWVFISVAKAYTRNAGKSPKGLQSLLEPIIIFVRDDIAKSTIGEKKYKKYLPFLLTIFFFIWISNMLGLVPILPGGANVTGNIAIALTLAAIVFIITIIIANKNYWKHVFAMPGVPIGVLLILTPIEILGLFLRPFVLMIRLFANILAGHIISLSFFSLIFIFAELNPALGWAVSPLSILFTVFMGMLELLVAFLQAYVFTLLAAMYFGSAIEEHHHAEEHH